MSTNEASRTSRNATTDPPLGISASPPMAAPANTGTAIAVRHTSTSDRSWGRRAGSALARWVSSAANPNEGSVAARSEKDSAKENAPKPLRPRTRAAATMNASVASFPATSAAATTVAFRAATRVPAPTTGSPSSGTAIEGVDSRAMEALSAVGPSSLRRKSRSAALPGGASSGPWTVGSRHLQGDCGADLLRVAELPERLALDQPHALAGKAEHLPGLPERQRPARVQAVAKRNDLALPVVQHALHGRADLLAQQRVLDLAELALGVGLLDEVAELGLLANGGLERQRLPASHLGQVVDLVHRGVEGLGQLLPRRLAAVLLGELEPGPVQLPQAVMDVHGQADGARPVGDRARDALADPPRGVGGELESAAPVEQLDGPHEADVPLLDQVEQGQALALVLAGHGHHQSEVGHDEPLPRGLGGADVLVRLEDASLGPEAAGAQALLGLLALLDGHGELDLLLLREEWLACGGLQVQSEVVGVVGAQRASRFSHLLPSISLHGVLQSVATTTVGQIFPQPWESRGHTETGLSGHLTK